MSNPFWAEIARRWASIGPPLRPSARDVEWIAQGLALARRPVQRVLVLGATPDYAALAERIGATAFALDVSGPMLHAVWPQPRAAVRGNWLRMPCADAAFDAVLGDGVLTLLGFPGAAGELARQVRRVLRPGGVFALRTFCDGHRGEGPDAVHALLEAGRIATFHELRFRLAMALQRDAAEGVAVRHLWEYWQRSAPDLSQHIGRPGWSREGYGIIDSYEHASERYRFPTPDEVRDVLAKDLREVGHWTAPEGGFGALCPTFAWRREP